LPKYQPVQEEGHSRSGETLRWERRARRGASASSAVRAAFYFAFVLRRDAQYFFIRSETAFRAAADILLRRRRRRVPPRGAAPSLAAPWLARPRNRSGKARRIDASSRLSSSNRDFAPSRARRRISSRLKSATHPPSGQCAGHMANTLACNPKLFRHKP